MKNVVVSRNLVAIKLNMKKKGYERNVTISSQKGIQDDLMDFLTTSNETNERSHFVLMWWKN